MSKFFRVIPVLLVAIISLPFSSSNSSAETPTTAISTASPIKVSMGVTSAISILPFVAQRKGFFIDEGVEVEMKIVQSAKLIMDSLIAGDVDTGALVDSSIAFIGFQENRIKVIASLGLRLSDALYYRKDAIHSPADLRGKKIGYVPATGSYLFLVRFLKANGLTFSDIKPVVLQAPVMAAALRGNAIDVASVWNPWGFAIMEQLGNQAARFENSKNFYPSRIFLATSDGLIKKDPILLSKMIAALKRAELFYREHYDEACKLIAADVNVNENQMAEYAAQYPFLVEKGSAGKQMVVENGELIRTEIKDFIGLPLPNYDKIFDDSLIK